MEEFKKEWKRRFEEIKKEKVKLMWKPLNAYNGIYEGEVRQIEGKSVPYGCGRWAGKYKQS